MRNSERIGPEGPGRKVERALFELKRASYSHASLGQFLIRGGARALGRSGGAAARSLFVSGRVFSILRRLGRLFLPRNGAAGREKESTKRAPPGGSEREFDGLKVIECFISIIRRPEATPGAGVGSFRGRASSANDMRRPLSRCAAVPFLFISRGCSFSDGGRLTISDASDAVQIFDSRADRSAPPARRHVRCVMHHGGAAHAPTQPHKRTRRAYERGRQLEK